MSFYIHLEIKLHLKSCRLIGQALPFCKAVSDWSIGIPHSMSMWKHADVRLSGVQQLPIGGCRGNAPSPDR